MICFKKKNKHIILCPETVLRVWASGLVDVKRINIYSKFCYRSKCFLIYSLNQFLNLILNYSIREKVYFFYCLVNTCVIYHGKSIFSVNVATL